MDTTLKDRINSDMRNAMKSGDTITRDTLRVLMAEVHRGQLTNDEDILPIIKKMIENLKEVSSETSLDEINVLQVYMPSQLTDEDMEIIVVDLINDNDYSSMKDMGKIMGHFSTHFPSRYDGKKLSTITRNKLTK